MAVLTTEQVRGKITDLLFLQDFQINPDQWKTKLTDLGVDSLDMCELVIGCEKLFQISITHEEQHNLKTPEDLVQLVFDKKVLNIIENKQPVRLLRVSETEK